MNVQAETDITTCHLNSEYWKMVAVKREPGGYDHVEAASSPCLLLKGFQFLNYLSVLMSCFDRLELGIHLNLDRASLLGSGCVVGA